MGNETIPPSSELRFGLYEDHPWEICPFLVQETHHSVCSISCPFQAIIPFQSSTLELKKTVAVQCPCRNEQTKATRILK